MNDKFVDELYKFADNLKAGVNIRKSGAFGLTEGDRFRYDINGRTGIAGEFTQDGDCYVVWDDGTHDTIKWNHMTKI